MRDAEYAQLAATYAVRHASHEAVAMALSPEEPTLAGQHPVDIYIAYALTQNPQIQAKRKLVDVAAQRVPQAASLQDPNVAVMGYPFFPNVPQTASGRMTVDLVVSQEVPWHGKLRALASAAEAEVEMARAELVAAELEVIEQVKRAYFELYFIQRSIDITRQSRDLAIDFSRIAEIRYTTGQVSQQDLLRAELEVSNTDAALVRLRQELQSGQARLTRLLHVSPETPVRALERLAPEDVPRDLERIYARAVAARPELHAQLAAVQRDRYAIDYARLQYFPDVTLSFGWGEMTTGGALAPTADGIDNLSIGMMANVPIYRRRLAAGVREAEARAVADARQYDNLRDRTLEEIKDLFAQAISQEELLRLFRTEIVPRAEQTLEVSVPAYEAGDVDFLTLTENWQQLLRFQIMQQRLEAQLRQSLASLERVMGTVMPAPPAIDETVEPLPPPFPESRQREELGPIRP